MLPGMMDPAKHAFYQHDNIEDVFDPTADTSIARTVEKWSQEWGRGIYVPQPNTFWPTFLNVRGARCVQDETTKSSINKDMWDSFLAVLEDHLLRSNSEWHVDAARIAVIANPQYWAI